MVQVILGGLTVLMLTALGAMILGWPRALIAGAIAAIYPAFVWLPRLLLSENLSLFLLLLSLGAIILYLRYVANGLDNCVWCPLRDSTHSSAAQTCSFRSSLLLDSLSSVCETVGRPRRAAPTKMPRYRKLRCVFVGVALRGHPTLWRRY